MTGSAEFIRKIADPVNKESNARKKGKRFTLAPGTQVREEDFGLLFYTMKGPRLFFLKCGHLLDPGFFRGEMSLAQLEKTHSLSKRTSLDLMHSFFLLKDKEIILEC